MTCSLIFWWSVFFYMSLFLGVDFQIINWQIKYINKTDILDVLLSSFKIFWLARYLLQIVKKQAFLKNIKI